MKKNYSSPELDIVNINVAYDDIIVSNPESTVATEISGGGTNPFGGLTTP